MGLVSDISDELRADKEAMVTKRLKVVVKERRELKKKLKKAKEFIESMTTEVYSYAMGESSTGIIYGTTPTPAAEKAKELMKEL